MTDLLHQNEKSALVRNKCPESFSVNLRAFSKACGNIGRCSSEFVFGLLYAGSSSQSAGGRFASYTHLPFVNLTLLPSPQTKI